MVDSDDWEGPGGWNEIGGYTPAQQRFFAWQERWSLAHADAVTVGAELVATLTRHLVEWLDASFPDVEIDSEAVAKAMIGQLLGLFVETQFCPVEDRDAVAAERARQLAALVLGST